MDDNVEKLLFLVYQKTPRRSAEPDKELVATFKTEELASIKAR